MNKAIRIILPLFLISASLLQAKIYDCFMFFNEYDILDIRFNELYDCVDHFVIVESCETHAGNEKSFRFEENKERYAKFLDKVIYVKLHEKQITSDPWVRENWQRNQIIRGLKDCNLKDTIIISDCDEIPSASGIKYANDLLHRNVPRIHRNVPRIVGFENLMSVVYLNHLWTGVCNLNGKPAMWNGSVCLRFEDILKFDCIHSIRSGRDNNPCISWIQDGWHFTYMGGDRTRKEKIKNWGHCNEVNEGWDRKGNETVMRVEIDERFPKYVRENIELLKSKDLID